MTELAIRVRPPELIDRLWNDPTEFDRAFERLTREFFPGFAPRTALAFWGGEVPALADVEDAGTSYRLRIDLPGIPKEKIDVRVQANVVTVKAEVDETKEGNFLQQERHLRRLERTFELPERVLGDQVKGEYKDGVLHLDVPKAHPATEQKVAIA